MTRAVMVHFILKARAVLRKGNPNYSEPYELLVPVNGIIIIELLKLFFDLDDIIQAMRVPLCNSLLE